MFTLIRLIWIALCAVPTIITVRRYTKETLPNPRQSFVRAAAAGGGGLLLLLAVRLTIFFYIEDAWFTQLSAAPRFWTEYITRITLAVVTFLVTAAASLAVLTHLRRRLHNQADRDDHDHHHHQNSAQRHAGLIVSLVGGIILASAAFGLWEEVLLFLNQPTTTVTDPAFGLSLSFYLFTLPVASAFLRLLGTFLFFLTIGSGYVIFAEQRTRFNTNATWADVLPLIHTALPTLKTIGALYLLRLAAGRLLAIPELNLRANGVVYGAGWMDVNITMPTLIIAAAVYIAAAVRLLRVHTLTVLTTPLRNVPRRTLITPAVLLTILFLARVVTPAVVGPLVLKPNEITLERPYLKSNITFTRHAYGVDDRHLTSTPVAIGRTVTPATLEGNQETIDNIRLWDPRALLDNLRQQQEIRLYYQFNNVDIDRYTIDGDYTQLMLSVRELEQTALSEESNTWVARHLKYTHGYGLVALPVHTIAEDGRPNLLVRDIPATSDTPRLDVTQPRIYYGERTDAHIYTATTEDEFDYPSDDGNTFNRYDGAGGVPIGGLLRRIAYATRFDGTEQLFSSYITDQTRLHWRREINHRVQTIAPFLRFDTDPYPVVTEDGRIVYIIDAYTVARTYPYSQHYQGDITRFRDINYIRNSVKVTVDAYNGTVTLYTMDPDDPILSAYRTIFPDLFTPLEKMPPDLRRHIRYPVDFMTVQAQMYLDYHMTNPDTFYQREDVWEFATERYRQEFQTVEPYYTLVNFPNRDTAEFIAMIPFTPANKNVIHAWMAAHSDAPNYGDLTVYTFPKGVEVLGPRQIEARIDQNTEMSRALSLWGQRGSEVIRGNLLAIPLFNHKTLTLLFAEPIFLQAEDASLPEIKRIVLADQDRVVWSNTFDTALDLLVGERRPEEIAVTTGLPAPTAADPADTRTLENARSALQRFSDALSNNDLEAAGRALDDLQDVLE